MTALFWLFLSTAYALLLTLVLWVGPDIAAEYGHEPIGWLLVITLVFGLAHSIRNYIKQANH